MQKFNYHTHTYRCGHADQDMTDEDFIKEYLQMGFEKIAFTDHCPQKYGADKRPKIRMEYAQKSEYIDSIKKLKEKYSEKIQIETGYEVEYLEEEEETLLELKKESEKIILGQHFILGENNELKTCGSKKFTDNDLITYAEYIEKAMKMNIPNIIAHPDLYMLERENFGNVEAKVANMICEAAEKYNIPLEINLNNIFANTYYQNRKLNNFPIEEQRKKLGNVVYPCREFWNIATKYNIKVLYGIDAHHRGHILLWNELVGFVEELLGKEIIEKLNFIEE